MPEGRCYGDALYFWTIKYSSAPVLDKQPAAHPSRSLKTCKELWCGGNPWYYFSACIFVELVTKDQALAPLLKGFTIARAVCVSNELVKQGVHLKENIEPATCLEARVGQGGNNHMCVGLFEARIATITFVYAFFCAARAATTTLTLEHSLAPMWLQVVKSTTLLRDWLNDSNRCVWRSR